MNHLTIKALVLLAGLAFLAGAAAAQPLSGTYTVNPLFPASPPNFTSLSGAVAALSAQGVSGPVVFDLYDDAGPYLESALFYAASPSPLSSNLQIGDNYAVVVFSQWTGVSATNTVTFRAAPGEYPVLDANGHAAVIYWNDADYTTIEGLDLRGATNDAVCLYTASTQTALNNTITRCFIHHCGRVGILTYGNSGAVNNTFISNNVFYNLMTNANGGGFSGFIRDGYISGRRDNGTQIVNNTFICNTMVTSFGWIIGNYPSGTNYTAFSRVSGNIFVKTAPLGTIFRHQTVLFTSPACSMYPAILPAIQDGNCYWDTSGGAFAIVGPVPSTSCPTFLPTTYATLAAWQAGVSKDVASVSADPLLGGTGVVPYHIQPGSPCVSLAGVIPGVTLDIDGQLRDAYPDAGADELGSGGQASATALGFGCPGSGNLVPLLSAAQVPYIGNSAFAVDINQARPLAPAYLFVAAGLEPAPVAVGGGCHVYLNVQSLLGLLAAGFGPFGPVTTSSIGTASFPMPVPNNPALSGLQLDFQAGIIDPVGVLGITLSNALDCWVY